jgi:hypothetical protein
MLIGIGFVAMSVVAYNRAGEDSEFARGKLDTWLEVAATVKRVEVVSKSYDKRADKKGRHSYRLVSAYEISFDTPGGPVDYQGKLEASGDTGGSAIPTTAYPKFKAGDKLPVTYNPDNPHELYFNETRDQVRARLTNPMQFGMPVIFGIGGAVLAGGCLLWLMKLLFSSPNG